MTVYIYICIYIYTYTHDIHIRCIYIIYPVYDCIMIYNDFTYLVYDFIIFCAYKIQIRIQSAKSCKI